MILFAITAGLISMCLSHFVVPMMYLRRIRVMAAWSDFRHQILAGRVGTLVLYALFQIVIGLAIGVLAMFATCLTCCLTIVPYVGTVILLPLFVFARSYNLCFLEQFGKEWTFFKNELPPKVPPSVTGHQAPPDTDSTNPFSNPPTS